MLLSSCIDEIQTEVCHSDDRVETCVFPKSFFDDSQISFLVLFFYPGDFTSICATELLAFHAQASVFKELGAAIVGCSTNGSQVHAAWKGTPKERGGLGTDIGYPILADVGRELCKRFDVHLVGRNVATRGLFIVDRNHRVLFEQRSDTKTARNVDDILAIVRELKKVTAAHPKRERADSNVSCS